MLQPTQFVPRLLSLLLQLLDRRLHPPDLLLDVLQPPVPGSLGVVLVLPQQDRADELVDVGVGGEGLELFLDGPVLFLLRFEFLAGGDGGLEVCEPSVDAIQDVACSARLSLAFLDLLVFIR